MLTIYYNPRCNKSRQTLKIIEESGNKVETINYLNDPLNEEELKDLVDKLGLPVTYLVRKGEKLYKENYKSREISEEEWFKILAKNPILIERPIVVKGDKAILGRPPENVESLL